MCSIFAIVLFVHTLGMASSRITFTLRLAIFIRIDLNICACKFSFSFCFLLLPNIQFVINLSYNYTSLANASRSHCKCDFILSSFIEYQHRMWLQLVPIIWRAAHPDHVHRTPIFLISVWQVARRKHHCIV